MDSILILILTSRSSRYIYVIVFFLVELILTGSEFLYPVDSSPILKDGKFILVNSIVIFLGFSGLTYLIILFKNQYDRERETVTSQNLKLDATNTEIEAQNEELMQYQEEVMAQRDFIEEKNRKLEQQAIELEKANEKIQAINKSLEEKVNDRTRKLMDLNNDLDLLVYRSSHDFRRPLTTLMGLNEIARLTVEDEVSIELFNRVNMTALNMDKMLLKFFMLYNINHFRTIYENNTLDEIINKIDKNLISRKRNIIFNRKIEIEIYNEKDERNSLIEIILENLVENSLIYNSKEQMAVDLEIIERDGNLHLYLGDNGNGIPLSYHDKVFEMYFRGSTLSTGNGLGLYVTKRAAGLLNASIKIDSKEGEYTKFEFVFKI